jgi:hypothetical protein
MEIVRLAYCEHSYKGIYQLVNNDGNFYWRKNNSLIRWDSVSKILPLYISSRDNRYLAFCMGIYEIEFKDNDL